MRLPRVFVVIFASVFLLGCEKSLEDQMAEYMEFYYPTTGQFYYDIVFDWGSYLITTQDKPGEEVHADSEKYLGYITMRPQVSTPSAELNPMIYLITAEGKVWSMAPTPDIAESSLREEVTVEESSGSTSTLTRTIDSPSEPVINHFLENPGAWSEYGALVAKGDGYKLERP